MFSFLQAGTILLWTSTPILVAVGTFTAYALTGHELTPVVAFTSLGNSFIFLCSLLSLTLYIALFNILRFPLNMLPSVISSMVECGVSLGRIQTYLANEELDPHATIFEQVQSSSQPTTQSPTIQHSSFIIHHTSYIIHHSSFIIHHSSFIIHHSSFIILHSLFIIHYSLFIIVISFVSGAQRPSNQDATRQFCLGRSKHPCPLRCLLRSKKG